MNLIQKSSDINDYLKSSDIIDFDALSIKTQSKKLLEMSQDKLDLIKNSFEFVRDQIKHSADADIQEVTCKAFEVLEKGHGICYAKAHLLAALLRANNIPTGLCYQKLVLNDDDPTELVLHGLNAVYLEEYKKWIRLDARGNKPGVNAQFSIDREQLAFPVRKRLKEINFPVIYSEPAKSVVWALQNFNSTHQLFENLPKTTYQENAFIIENLKKEDLTNCANLYSEVFSQEPWNENWTFDKAKRRLAAMFNSTNFFGLKAVIDNELAGFCLGNSEYWLDDSLFYLKEMCIKSSYQHQEIGTKLIKQLKVLLKGKIQTLYLLTKRNTMAHKFYLKNEFEVLDDIVYMDKNL